MKQAWRWFGPADIVGLSEIRQAGATSVVSALHHVPNGTVWSREEISRRQDEVACRADGSPSGLTWGVIESLAVSEDIKKQSGDWREHLANYRESLENIAAAGIEVVCYNFMPLLDWTRTDLAFALPDGATCMRFDLVDFAVFDLFLLARPGALEDYPDDTVEDARRRHAGMGDDDRARLTRNIVAGLPGSNEKLSVDAFSELLSGYAGIDADRLRAHHHTFLEEVVPTAERLGLRLCCHPDDPPHALLGLPRVVSSEDDYSRMIRAVPSRANGLTLCSGSLGVAPDNDVPGMMGRLGAHVHFLHLRNVRREDVRFPGSFHEAAHLDGSTDMQALVSAVVAEEKRRRTEGRADWSIPMRPDHGHVIADDHHRARQPGYPLIGRLRGLAELRGLYTGLGGDIE